MKDLIATLKEGANNRATIEQLIEETNSISSLSDAYHSFDDHLRYVRLHLKLTDDEITSHINLVLCGDFNKQTAEVVPVDVYRLMISVKELISVAKSHEVNVDFPTLISINGYDIDEVPYWNTSSLYC